MKRDGAFVESWSRGLFTQWFSPLVRLRRVLPWGVCIFFILLCRAGIKNKRTGDDEIRARGMEGGGETR